jgi:DNA polymerase bacteriophage-type
LTHPAEWAQFIEYAKADIPSMRAVHKKLPMWNYSGKELDLWFLDQRINEKGVQVDVELASCAIDAVARAQSNLARRTALLTDGEVARTTQRNKMLEYLLARYGVDLPDLKKSTIERRLDDPDLPWALKELLNNRLQASSSSTSKYKTLVKGVSADGRLRGLLQFDGAQRTKRWAGRLFQPQNLTRPNVGDLHGDELQAEIEFGIECIKANCEDLIYE